ETVLIHAIDCRRGELIIRTTTVAQELSRKALKLGVIAGSAATQILGRLQEAGRAVAEDIREELAAANAHHPTASTRRLAEEPSQESDDDSDDSDLHEQQH
ncbi:MAG: hypothetical protein AAFX99_27940, partial [Myxococcota bacterium]